MAQAASPSRKLWLIGLGGLGGAVGLWALFRKTASPIRAIVEPAIETRLHVVDDRGVVLADPKGLADVAGVPLVQYALASMMQSEEKTDRGRLAVGRAAWNMARGNPKRLLKLLIPRGRFGSQTINPYAATSKPPTARTLDLAAAILVGRVPDFLKGAVQWDAPKVQDRNHQKFLANPAKYPKYKYDSKAIAEIRKSKGATMVILADVPETRFWTYAKAAA
jgi:hypothetical protein